MKSSFEFRLSSFGLSRARRIAFGIAGFVVALALPAVARAQGCAMCYTSASAARKAGMEALQKGVFILLFPPLLIFAVILWQTFRRRSIAELESVQTPSALFVESTEG